MEVDILNDLLSRTVSNLFVNKSKHMSYLSEDDGDKQEIFPQEVISKNNQNNQKSSLNSHNSNHINNNSQNEQPKKNLIEKIINNNKNNIQKNNKQNSQNNQNNQNNQNPDINSPKVWCMTIGKKKYEESLHRLQINERIIASKTLINEMSLEQLTNEKARVKQELKKYDEDFYQVFKSKPTKENKEIMKPLYYYYQKLKLAISKKQSDQTSTASETIVKNDQNNNNNHHHGNISQSIYPSTMTNDDSVLTQEVSSTNSNLITNSELVTNPSESNRQSKYSQMNNNVYHNSMYNAGTNKQNNNTGYNVFHRKANSGGGISSASNPQIKIDEFNLKRNPQKRSLSKEEINALEQEYFSIKKEQNNLTQMLRNYQNEFQKTNNRKVKWTKDIKPVEKEYNKYKANKERIKQIKELFGHIENNNK